jgi:phospholipase/carboxylesterase
MKGRTPELPQRCIASSTKMSAPRLRVVTPEEIEGRTSVSRSWPRRPNRSPAAYPIPAEPGLFLPQGYERGYRYPLLVWLPDSSQPIDFGRAMGRLSLRNYVAIEAAPTIHDADEAMWQAIDHATAVTNIHPERIFLIGVSQGGTAALRLACRHATAIAGGVSLGGPFPLDEGSLGRLSDVRRLPMLMCTAHTNSTHEAASIERTLRVFHAAGASLAMRIYPSNRRLTRSVLQDVNRWLMDTITGPAQTAAQLPLGA